MGVGSGLKLHPASLRQILKKGPDPTRRLSIPSTGAAWSAQFLQHSAFCSDLQHLQFLIFLQNHKTVQREGNLSEPARFVRNRAALPLSNAVRFLSALVPVSIYLHRSHPRQRIPGSIHWFSFAGNNPFAEFGQLPSF